MSRAALFTKRNLFIAIAAVLIAVPGTAFLLGGSAENNSGKGVKGTSSNSSTSNTTVDIVSKSSQSVNGETTKQQTGYITYQGQDGKTALELLKQTADVKTDQTEFGEMVTEINGADGGGEKYWIFFVGGKMAEVGAGEYETKNGEVIEWKLQ